jgi:hypothetical protein
MTAFKSLTLTLLAATALGGCTTFSLGARHEAAMEIARSAAMNERVITAGLFNLTAWERAPAANTPVDLYIEGDGLAWLDAHTKSLNPTPPHPLALQLAAKDKAANVVYMARPCQYTGWNGKGACPDLYWSNGRTAPEVIAAYQSALNNIKNTYHVSGFNLIGYSGGAAVAALVAAARTDVLSLRTVAGNTDYTTFTTLHSTSPMDASLEPITAAPTLAALPQLHFIGGADTVVPSIIFNSWKQASGTSPCVQSVTVPDASHEKGWIEKWPALLNAPLPCPAP